MLSRNNGHFFTSALSKDRRFFVVLVKKHGNGVSLLRNALFS